MKKNEIEKYTSIPLEEMQAIMNTTLKKVHDICEQNQLRYVLAYGTLLGAIRHNGFIPWDDDIDIMMPRKDFNRFLEIAQAELGETYFLQTPLTDAKYSILHVPVKVRDNNSTLIEEANKDYHQGAFVDIFALDYIDEQPQAFYKIRKKCAFLTSLKMRISWKEQHGIKKIIRIFLQLLCKAIPASVIYRYTQKQAKKFESCEETAVQIGSGIGFLEKEVYAIDDIFPAKLHTYDGYQFYIPNHEDAVLRQMYGDYMKLPSESERTPHGILYSNTRLF